MMTTRQSAIYALFLGGLVLAILSGCSAGNPNISAAERAMEQQDYEQALTNVDSAIVQDSANIQAYMMKARILRQMADSSTPLEQYKEFYRRARQAEEKAIKFDPGRRSEVQSQRRLAYIQEFQKGAKAFNQARRTQNQQDFLRAAAYFGAAGAVQPDSTGPILNEAYARLNAAQVSEEGDNQMMKEVIPILQRYLQKAEAPTKSAYTILAQLYLQSGQTQKVIDLTSRAIEDLSNRPTHFRLSGPNGLKYTGTVEEGGSSRSVKGAVPDRIRLSTSEGVVSGRFQKVQKKGTLRATLYVRGGQVTSDQITRPSDTLTISQDLSGLSPLAQLRNFRLNAFNKSGRTAEAMELYRQEIQRNPNNATYRYNYGSLLLNDDRYDAAAKQLSKAVELDPDDPKKQYNLGAAYLNKGVMLQDSLVAMRDSVLQNNRKPTEEEEQMLRELDKNRRALFKEAIPPLERARQLSSSGGQYLQDACRALFQAYVQLEMQEEAEQVQSCAGNVGGEGGNQSGSGSGGGGGF